MSEVTPSIITKGSLPPVMEVVPRTLTLFNMANLSEPLVVTLTPADCPLNASNALLRSPFLMSFCLIDSVLGFVETESNSSLMS